jgi:hypothetical protein
VQTAAVRLIDDAGSGLDVRVTGFQFPDVAGGSVPGGGTLTFVEPNLSWSVVGYRADVVVLDVGLDLEFSPPWRRRIRAGDPFVLRCRPTRERLGRAADEWTPRSRRVRTGRRDEPRDTGLKPK